MILEAAGWQVARDGDPRLLGHYDRHYSSRKWRTPRRLLRRQRQALGPGEALVLSTPDGLAAFAWRRHRGAEEGVECSIFRNEGPRRSSDLIREAVDLARERWPGERLYTYVDARRLPASSNPGYCFLMAGWTRLKRRTKERGLRVLELAPECFT